MKAPAVLSVVLFSSLAACGGDDMTGPSGMSASRTPALLMSVTPQGGASGVPVSSPMVLRFGAAMGAGMEQYVDLHVGDLGGPTVPLSCGWSGDRTTLTCTPQAPLSHLTTYVLHVGGGMTTQTGQPLDFAQHGPMMGGQWVMGGMMGASHGGHPWGTMGPGWRNANGSYGMAFTFTTA
ncbi:MAG TPA: Ig-like domain-containing protein [Vicinamibacteria bacterium]|nr:Ig-like domain-containing protein [Vicinamibacteria bacterium]